MTDLFDGVIGHGRIVELLETELASSAQAYLFVGPQAVGKATIAARFAAGLLCPTHGVHDGECRSCRLALARTHPDLTVVEPEGATSLGVEQVREVVSRSSMAPIESARTVFLFPDAGSMTESAATSLLKTLEEPTSSVVFLLVSESEDDFPSTVSSRCRTVQFGRVPQATIVSELQSRGLGSDEASGVAIVSGGRPGLALALMTQPEVARFRELWLSVPGTVTPNPGDGQRLASVMLSELAPLVEDSVPEGLTKDEAQRARRGWSCHCFSVVWRSWLRGTQIRFAAVRCETGMELSAFDCPPKGCRVSRVRYGCRGHRFRFAAVGRSGASCWWSWVLWSSVKLCSRWSGMGCRLPRLLSGMGWPGRLFIGGAALRGVGSGWSGGSVAYAGFVLIRCRLWWRLGLLSYGGRIRVGGRGRCCSGWRLRVWSLCRVGHRCIGLWSVMV